MSIESIFNSEEKERERKRKADALAQSMATICRESGLTESELIDALKSAVDRKRLISLDKTLSEMGKRSIQK